jgi:hypothetical protein
MVVGSSQIQFKYKNYDSIFRDSEIGMSVIYFEFPELPGLQIFY